jgi:hypothetical protein
MEWVCLAGEHFLGVIYADKHRLRYVAVTPTPFKDGQTGCPEKPTPAFKAGKVAQLFQKWLKTRLGRVANPAWLTAEEVPSPLPP